jgi:hypothetical protein
MLFLNLQRRTEATHPPLTTRRGALGIFGLAGLSLMASATPAHALLTVFKRPPVELADFPELADLPALWVRQQGADLANYCGYLQSLKLKRVTPGQVIAAHAKNRGRVWNSLPPKSQWKNMAPTLRAVDRVAAELDMPVQKIISAYRSRSYNARCPGAASGSWHQANVAVDVEFPVSASVVAHTAKRIRDKGYFKGGIGRYPGFTHIDTRGANQNW